jgi:hypothetical protein
VLSFTLKPYPHCLRRFRTNALYTSSIQNMGFEAILARRRNSWNSDVSVESTKAFHTDRSVSQQRYQNKKHWQRHKRAGRCRLTFELFPIRKRVRARF